MTMPVTPVKPVETPANVGATNMVAAKKPLVNATASKPLYSLTDIKSWEKLGLYIVATISATNGFAQLSIPGGIREWLIGGSALVLAFIHNSTPR